MAQQEPQFFAGWQAPPQLTPAPASEALAQRIVKLAQFAARNGPSFVELIKTKQKENPEYTFLFAGEGADYYHWVLFCHLYNVSMDQPSATEAQAAPAWPDPGPQVQHQPHIAASSAAGTMSALSGVPHVSPLVESVVQAEVVGASGPASGQHVRPRARWDQRAGLLGSSLLQQQQQQQQQPVGQPLSPMDHSMNQYAQQQPLGQPLNSMDQYAQQQQQQQQYGQHAYPEAMAYPQQGAYSGAVSHGYPVQDLPPALAYAYPEAQQWAGPPEPMAGPHATWGSGPAGGPAVLRAPMYMSAPHQAGMYLPPAAPPPPVAKDPMSFPPGLIPQLVKEKLRTETPYSPLSTLEVEAAGMPPPSEPDAYLRARIDRFYAELQDYRAGVARADVEAEQRRQRRLEGRGGGADEEDSGRRQSARWEPMMEPATGQNADGSFSQAGASASKAAGLGFDEPCPQASSTYGSCYDAFRNSRSGRYHETLARNQFAAAASRGSS